MRGVVGAAVLVVAAFATLGPGCDREDLVVATVGDGAAGDGGIDSDAAGDAGALCHDDDDCVGASALYCEKTGCGPVGTCQVPSCVDLGVLQPVCGCDGLTYWNDCARQDSFVSLRHADGPCGSKEGDKPQPCHGNPDCAAGTFCSIIVAPERSCDAPTGGCWQVPDCATAAQDPVVLRPCDDADGVCESSCEAIRKGLPFRYDENGCQN